MGLMEPYQPKIAVMEDREQIKEMLKLGKSVVHTEPLVTEVKTVKEIPAEVP